MKPKILKAAKQYWDSPTPIMAGKLIYDHLEPTQRPLWAAGVLQLVDHLAPDYSEIEVLYNLVVNPAKWILAKPGFDAIRKLSLKADSTFLEAHVLRLAEKVAKVTYNASGKPAPFDYSAGYGVVTDLKKIVELADDKALSEQAWTTLCTVPSRTFSK